MINFHYIKSFYLLIPFGLLIALYAWSRVKRRQELARLGEWRVIQELVPIEAMRRRIRKDVLALIAMALTIFTAAGPQFGSRLKEVKHRGIDVFIAVDTSRSMLAEDVPPNRLARAKQSLGLLIEKLEGHRVGIIAFAGYGVVQCPLTVDSEAAKMFLEVLDENTVPKQGTAIGDAIRLALQGFNKDDKAGKAIVLLTDGEDHRSDPTGAAKEAKDQGAAIFTIGIGTTRGEVIKDKDEQGRVTSFHKFKGEMVLSRLDDALLSKIASIAGGQYYRASSTDREIDEIADILNGYEKKEFSARIYQRLEERFQWFGFAALLLLLLEFLLSEKPGLRGRLMQALRNAAQGFRWTRKGTAAILIVALTTAPSFATLKEQVRKGNQLVKKKDLVGARGEFESARVDYPDEPLLPYNIGTTYYLEGNLEEAKRSYEQALNMATDPRIKAKIAYNLGHVEFHLGKKDEAIRRFKDTLRWDAADKDAKYNIEYIRSGKTPQNPPPQQQKQDQNQQNQQDKKEGEPEQKDEQKGEGEGEQQPQPEPGRLSKEDAERVLEMIEEQERDKFKNAKTMKLGKPEDEKKNPSGEDW